MPAGVPVTAKLTVMSALGESHSKPQPGVFVPTARACGGLAVVREVGRSKQQSEWTKRKVGVAAFTCSTSLVQPGDDAAIFTMPGLAAGAWTVGEIARVSSRPRLTT